MFVYCEMIDGHVYAVDDRGDVWRLRYIHRPDGPVMERICTLELAAFKRALEPRLAQFVL